jgi:hypothetical protein
MIELTRRRRRLSRCHCCLRQNQSTVRRIEQVEGALPQLSVQPEERHARGNSHITDVGLAPKEEGV